jgi:hypothetical protein
MSRSTTRQRGLVAAGSVALAIVASACFPQDPPVTTAPTTVPECVPAPVTVTNGAATLTVSQANCLEVGDEITVTGSGYTTTGNVGTRAPFPGRPSGVYVVHGEFADPWRPSAGVASGARKVLSQHWAVPEPTYTENTNQQAPYVPMDASGGFSVTVTVAESTGTNPTLGVATYPGSGATNAGEEILIPLTLDPAV